MAEKSGKRLRRARESAGLTQGELAQRVGLKSHTRLSNYEQGAREIRPDFAVVLSRALSAEGVKTSPAYLLGVEHDAGLSEEEQYLLDCYRQTDLRGRKTLLKIAELQLSPQET